MRKGLNRMILRNIGCSGRTGLVLGIAFQVIERTREGWSHENYKNVFFGQYCTAMWSDLARMCCAILPKKVFLRGKYACAQCYQHGHISITKKSPKSGGTPILDMIRTKRGFLAVPGQCQIKDTVVKKDYIPWWKISKQSRRFAHYYYWIWQHRIQARVI